VRTVFLLGSGISLDAEMPGVAAITDQVVSGVGVFLHSANVFLIDADNPNYANWRAPVEPVLALVQELREIARVYFGREPNYEEIAQITRQLSDALSGEYESAAVMPLAERLAEHEFAGGDLVQLRELTELVHKYIVDSVTALLTREATRLDHLGMIIQACEELDAVDLATLNHDLVLEAALRKAGISYSDGFDNSDEDVRLWADEWAEGRTRLLKLHGSLDWWGYQITDEPWRGWVAGRYRGDDPIHPKRGGIEDYPHDLRPLILTGTFDKILAYETWVFPDQHLRFHEGLRQASRVVVIGYGFGDKAINTRLIGWLARARENKLIVGHGDPDELRASARGAIQSKWDIWRAEKKLAVIPDWVACLSWDAVRSELG
jgi:hypothetical protein